MWHELLPRMPRTPQGPFAPALGLPGRGRAPSLVGGGAGAPQAPTDLTVVSLPGQEATAGTRVPDTDLAGIGAAEQQGLGPVAQGRQLARPHRLGDGLSVHLEGHKGSVGQSRPRARRDPSSKAASGPWHLEADVGPALLQEPQGEGALAHAGELPGSPGAEGHVVHWLWEAGGRQELIGSCAP